MPSFNCRLNRGVPTIAYNSCHTVCPGPKCSNWANAVQVFKSFEINTYCAKVFVLVLEPVSNVLCPILDKSTSWQSNGTTQEIRDGRKTKINLTILQIWGNIPLPFVSDICGSFMCSLVFETCLKFGNSNVYLREMRFF